MYDIFAHPPWCRNGLREIRAFVFPPLQPKVFLGRLYPGSLVRSEIRLMNANDAPGRVRSSKAFPCRSLAEERAGIETWLAEESRARWKVVVKTTCVAAVSASLEHRLDHEPRCYAIYAAPSSRLSLKLANARTLYVVIRMFRAPRWKNGSRADLSRSWIRSALAVSDGGAP